MLSIAVVQTKVISCNSANKSCLLQVVHTKAIAALTQFCDFLDIYVKIWASKQHLQKVATLFSMIMKDLDSKTVF